MKKLCATCLALGLLGSIGVGFCAPVKVQPKAVPAPMHQMPPMKAFPGYVSVTTTSEEEYAPNIATITFYVENSNKILNTATDENKKTSAKAIEAVKKAINTANGDSIKTLSFNVNSEYSYPKDGKRVFEKYNVTNSFEVRLKNIQELGKIIDTALNSGATRVDGLKFSLDADEARCNELIAKSTQIAKQRAQNVANSLGSKLGGIKEINASCNSQSEAYAPYRTYGMAKMNADSAGGESAVPTEAGLIKIKATTDGQFWLIQ